MIIGVILLCLSACEPVDPVDTPSQPLVSPTGNLPLNTTTLSPSTEQLVLLYDFEGGPRLYHQQDTGDLVIDYQGQKFIQGYFYNYHQNTFESLWTDLDKNGSNELVFWASTEYAAYFVDELYIYEWCGETWECYKLQATETFSSALNSALVEIDSEHNMFSIKLENLYTDIPMDMIADDGELRIHPWGNHSVLWDGNNIFWVGCGFVANAQNHYDVYGRFELLYQVDWSMDEGFELTPIGIYPEDSNP